GGGRDEPAVLVVLVVRGGLPALEAAQRDAEPFGRLYSGSERRILEAAREKGTSTSRRLRLHAASDRSSNCREVSDWSSAAQSSSSSSGSTTDRRTNAGKKVSVLTPIHLSRSSTSPDSVLRGGCSARNAVHSGRGMARSRNSTVWSSICCR